MDALIGVHFFMSLILKYVSKNMVKIKSVP